MLKYIYLFAIFTVELSAIVYCQTGEINVADFKLKVGALQTKEFFFGFAKGDQIVFNLEVEKGKPIKRVEILELPFNSIYRDFKVSVINDKRISALNKGVYQFTLYNSSISGRVCSVRISRIPKTEDLRIFNTNWKWKTLYDTTYVSYTEDSLVGYNTRNYIEKVKELSNTVTKDEIILDRKSTVHSLFNNDNRAYIRVDLPNNKITPYRTETVISWIYWIGVGEESMNAYNANVKKISNIVSGAAAVYGTPLAAMAVGALSELATAQRGEDVGYYFIENYSNLQAFINKQPFYQFIHGKGIDAYGQNSNRLQGTFYIGLDNDNQITPINANVKIGVIKEIKTFVDKEYDRQEVTPNYVTLHKTRMVVTRKQIRVNVE